jgi:hypothetical protein
MTQTLLSQPLTEDFEDHIGRLSREVIASGSSVTGINHYDLRAFHTTDLTVPRTMPDFKYWNAANFDGVQMITLTSPRSVVGRSVASRIMTELDTFSQGVLDPLSINDIELATLQSGNESWPTGDANVIIGKDSALRYANSIRVNLTGGVTKTVTSSFRDNILADLPNDGSTYYVELALPGFPSQTLENAGTALTVSGNEITDARRTEGVGTNVVGHSYDARTNDSSFGIWEATTNLFTNGGFETNTTGWQGYATGSLPIPTLTRDTAQKVFGAASLRVDTQGSNSTEGVISSLVPVTPGVTYTYSVWVLATAGQTIQLNLDWKTATSLFITSQLQHVRCYRVLATSLVYRNS